MEIKKAIHWAIITPSNEQTDGRELGEETAQRGREYDLKQEHRQHQFQ